MSKSILVIDTKDLKDMIEVLRMNEMYCEANVLEQCPLQETTELLEALEWLNRRARIWGECDLPEEKNGFLIAVKKDYDKLHKALGGKDE